MGAQVVVVGGLFHIIDVMGRSAKLVRCPAFEKKKRAEQGKEWRPSSAKEGREEHKAKKRADREEADKRKEAEAQCEVDRKLKAGLAGLGVAGGSSFISLSDAAFGGAASTVDEIGKGSGGTGMDVDSGAKPAKATKGKKKSSKS